MDKLEIATLVEVGQRLRQKRKDAALSAQRLAEMIDENMSETTVIRWEEAEREGGCIQVAQAGAILGLQPNDLLLKTPGNFHGVTEESQRALTKVFVELSRMIALLGSASPEAITTLADFFKNQNDKWTKDIIPAGTLIQKKDGVKTYDPPTGSGSSSVAEDTTEYQPQIGKKKKRKS